jgi:hypothetical protein
VTSYASTELLRDHLVPFLFRCDERLASLLSSFSQSQLDRIDLLVLTAYFVLVSTLSRLCERFEVVLLKVIGLGFVCRLCAHLSQCALVLSQKLAQLSVSWELAYRSPV